MTVILTVVLAPLALANDASLKITSSQVLMNQNVVKGSVQVCNQEGEGMNFTIEAKNVETNHLYKRKFGLASGECKNYKLNFTGDFKEMSNAGDTIRFSIKKMSGQKTNNEYKSSVNYTTKIQEGNEDEKCKDSRGKDGLYTNLCAGDFIYHTPSGLRVKLASKDGNKVDLILNHIQWGGTKKVKLYKGKTTEVVSGNETKTRVILSNLDGGTLKFTSY